MIGYIVVFIPPIVLLLLAVIIYIVFGEVGKRKKESAGDRGTLHSEAQGLREHEEMQST